MHSFDVRSVNERLKAGNGGYEIVHESPVLEGSGMLDVEGESTPVQEGSAVFVPAGADHRFVGYEGLSVLVIFARPATASR
jgi:quercetin dioxygenase-like cupin family protein